MQVVTGGDDLCVSGGHWWRWFVCFRWSLVEMMCVFQVVTGGDDVCVSGGYLWRWCVCFRWSLVEMMCVFQVVTGGDDACVSGGHWWRWCVCVSGGRAAQWVRPSEDWPVRGKVAVQGLCSGGGIHCSSVNLVCVPIFLFLNSTLKCVFRGGGGGGGGSMGCECVRLCVCVCVCFTKRQTMQVKVRNVMNWKWQISIFMIDFSWHKLTWLTRSHGKRKKLEKVVQIFSQYSRIVWSGYWAINLDGIKDLVEVRFTDCTYNQWKRKSKYL